MILISGDIHAEFRIFYERLEKMNVDLCLQVGDMGDEKKEYVEPPIPIYFIQGNHENWGILFDGKLPKNLYYIDNGGMIEVEGLKVIGFGGNYSSRYYDKKKSEIQGARKRHYVKEEFDRALINATRVEPETVDVLITHEAPSPYTHRGMDCGKEQISDLVQSIKPRVHFFGHHHYYGEYDYFGVKSYGLNYGYKEGILLNPETFEIERVFL